MYPPYDDRPASLDSDRRRIHEDDEDDPNEIITDAPKERFRLGYLDVTCLIINRMIGTGIFMGPTRVMNGTKSAGMTLLFWFFGMFYTLAGGHVYVEYGLNVPRYVINGVEQSVPRSGGDLNYLQYIYRTPRYRKDTVLFVGCLFGISFICLGNMAGNCISFADRILRAATDQGDVRPGGDGAVRGIAIAVATFACFIHAFSRRGGLLLNNVLALIKIGILLLIIIATIVVAAGGFHGARNYLYENTNASNAFKNPDPDNSNPADAKSYTHAFLSIIYAFSGFDQPNYVLGEIDRPRRKFPRSMGFGVGIVAILYMVVNICYMVVVPADKQLNGDVAETFFNMTFGKLNGDTNVGARVYNAFLAISSLGNIIVMTYTAARMKQEIAKEGFLPFAKFFAQNRDVSFGRILKWIKKHGWLQSLFKSGWLSPEDHSEKTPVGALVLHFLSCVVLLFATYNMNSDDAYDLLSGFWAYLVTAFFGFFLALGILILRFYGPPKTSDTDNPGTTSAESPEQKPAWKDMVKGTVNPYVSVIAAVLYLVGNAFPLITNWVPSSNSERQTFIQQYGLPMISWCVLGLGAAWFLGFIGVAKRIEHKHQEIFVVERKPDFQPENPNDDEHPHGGDEADGGESGGRKRGGLVLLHETVYMSWKGKDTLAMQAMAQAEEVYDKPMVASGLSRVPPAPISSNNLSGTDFDGLDDIAMPSRPMRLPGGL